MKETTSAAIGCALVLAIVVAVIAVVAIGFWR